MTTSPLELKRIAGAGPGFLLLISAGALVYFTRTDACLFSKYAALGAVLLSCVRMARPDALRGGIPMPELLLILSSVIWDRALQMLSSQHIPMLDQYLFQMDRALGEPAYLMGRLFAAIPVLAWASALAYSAVPLVIAGTYLTAPRKREFCAALLVASALGCLCFFAIPAAGPAFAFPGFPWRAPAIDRPQRMILPQYPPNCMPSLHFAWALLILFYARRRALAGIFLGLTACATLGSGQHYSVDLLAAIPFSVAVVWIVRRDWLRAAGWAMPQMRAGLGAAARRSGRKVKISVPVS